MNSQIIVIVQVLIAGTFILWILSRKGSTPKPTVLNLSQGNRKRPESKPKMLNVIFMWNGHTWDAYEVFGLPAGSPLEKVNERYAELLAKSDSGQREFLNAARSAIQSKVG